MVGIKGIGGIPEPVPEQPTGVRERAKREEVRNAEAQDGVRISAEAQEAATVARLVQIAKQEPDIRPDRVAEAKEKIERGDYKLPNVLAEVARRISEYLF